MSTIPILNYQEDDMTACIVGPQQWCLVDNDPFVRFKDCAINTGMLRALWDTL